MTTPNRALMGSNMQRQAVPLLRTESPLVGTGVEYWAARDSGEMLLSPVAGEVTLVTGEEIHCRATDTGRIHRLPLRKFERSNQGTSLNQKPIVSVGQKVKKRDVLADGPSTAAGELAVGQEPADRLYALERPQLRGRHRGQRTAGERRCADLGAYRRA